MSDEEYLIVEGLAFRSLLAYLVDLERHPDATPFTQSTMRYIREHMLDMVCADYPHEEIEIPWLEEFKLAATWEGDSDAFFEKLNAIRLERLEKETD